MLELRSIAGEPFFVERDGRRETIHTAGEALAAMEQRIAAARARQQDLATAQQDAQRRLEEALLAGADTGGIHVEIAKLRDQAAAAVAEVQDARDGIAQIHRTLDGLEADRIRAADAARLAALVAAYDHIIKENAV